MFWRSVLVIMFLCTPAAARSGAELLSSCEGAIGTFDYAACHGYVGAIVDASQCGTKVTDFSSRMPKGASGAQMVKVVIKWLNAHPEALHYNAAGLVANALQDAFPC